MLKKSRLLKKHRLVLLIKLSPVAILHQIIWLNNDQVRLGGKTKRKKSATNWPVRPVYWAVWPVPRAVWPVSRLVWLVRPIDLGDPPRLKLELGRALKSSCLNMRRRELRRSRRDDQTKSRMQSQHQHLVSSRMFAHVKVIVLLCHIQGWLLYCFGHIHVITHLWIKIGCICNLITFNILLCIQVVYRLDQLLLATIWSTKIFIAARRVKRARSKIQNIYSRGGVPQAYHTLKREDCNIYASKSWWNNKWRSTQPN